MQTAISSLTTGTGKFAGLTKESSRSLQGLFSTLKDNIGGALAGLGKTIIDTFGLKNITGALTGFVQRFKKEWLPAIAGVLRGARLLWDSTIGFMSRLWGGLFGGAGGEVLEGLKLFLRNFDIFLKLGRAHVLLFVRNASTMFGNLRENAFEIFSRMASGIGKVFVNLFKQLLSNAVEFGKQLLNAIKGKGFDASKFGFDILKGARGDFAKVGQLLGKGLKKVADDPVIQGLMAQLVLHELNRLKKKPDAPGLPGGLGGGGGRLVGGSVKQGPVEGAIRGSSEFFRRLTQIRQETKEAERLAVAEAAKEVLLKIEKNTRRKPAFEAFDPN